MRDDGSRDAAHQVPHEPRAAVRADHDQARVVLLGGLDDALPGRRGLDRHAWRAEAGLLRQRGSVGGGLLRGPSTSDAWSASKCRSLVGTNPTSAGCQTQTTSACLPGRELPRPAR